MPNRQGPDTRAVRYTELSSDRLKGCRKGPYVVTQAVDQLRLNRSTSIGTKRCSTVVALLDSRGAMQVGFKRRGTLAASAITHTPIFFYFFVIAGGAI
jgi:hypothetical protein